MRQTLQLGPRVRVPDVRGRACAAGQVTSIRTERDSNDAVAMSQTDILPGLGGLPCTDDPVDAGSGQLGSVWTELDLVDDVGETHRHAADLLAASEGPDTR